VLAGPWLGALFLPLAAVRFIASTGQLILNRALGHRQPLAARDRLDWLLFALTFLAACGASAVDRAFDGPFLTVALACVLLPYSAIQLRMTARCYRAFEAHRTLPPPIPFPTPTTSTANRPAA